MPIQQKLKLFTLIFTLLLPCVSHAGKSAIIFMEGKAPSRVVYVAEFLGVKDRTPLSAVMDAKNAKDLDRLGREQKQVMMHVLAVYETKDQPESVDMSVEFQCHPKNYSIVAAHALYRDLTVKSPIQGWKPIASSESAWPAIAAKVACENEKVWNASEKASKGNWKELEQIGLIYIGDISRTEAVDVVWEKVWAGSPRPAYMGKKRTEKERKEDMERMEKDAAAAIAQLDSAAAGAQTDLNKLEAERKFKTEMAKNPRYGKMKNHKQLGWMMERTESEVVGVAGAPINAVNAGNSRFLTYYNEYFLQGAGYTYDNNGNPVSGGTTVTCEVKIQLRQGGTAPEPRVVSYELNATNGGCHDFSWFNKGSLPSAEVTSNKPSVTSTEAAIAAKPVQEVAPAETAKSKWGALAMDKKKLHVDYMNTKYIGLANNESTKQNAENFALGECKKDGGEKCEVIDTFANACMALSAGVDGLEYATNADKVKANESALQRCNKKFKACRVIYSACSQ